MTNTNTQSPSTSTLSPSTRLTWDSEGALCVEYPELYQGEPLWMPEEDPVTPSGAPHHWQDLLGYWWSRWHDQPIELLEIIEMSIDCRLFPQLMQKCDSLRALETTFGIFMKRNAGKPLHGYRFFPLHNKKGKKTRSMYVLLNERSGAQAKEW